MTKMHYSITAAVAGLLIASASSAWAGGPGCCSSACCSDGIAASPKVRAMLDERCRSKCATPAVAVAATAREDNTVAGSPKVRQMRADQHRTAAPDSGSQIVGYRAVGDDGIAASPKVRATLDSQSRVIQIAP